MKQRYNSQGIVRGFDPALTHTPPAATNNHQRTSKVVVAVVNACCATPRVVPVAKNCRSSGQKNDSSITIHTRESRCYVASIDRTITTKSKNDIRVSSGDGNARVPFRFTSYINSEGTIGGKSLPDGSICLQ